MAENLREFLVSLGFRIDASCWGKHRARVERQPDFCASPKQHDLSRRSLRSQRGGVGDRFPSRSVIG